MTLLLPAKGVQSLSDEKSLDSQTLREAVNVDITREGRVRRRAGRTRVVPGAAVHSLWAHDQFPYAMFADGNALFALSAGWLKTTVATGLAVGLPIRFDAVNGVAFWTNGVQGGCYTADGDPALWACETPSGQPTLAVAAAGGLDAGVYQVAVTFRDNVGRESGTGIAAEIDVPSGAGISLTAIPQPQEPGIVSVRVYRTAANDSSLRHVMDLPVGITQVLLGASDRGKVLETQHHVSMPVGQLVAFGHGRQWVARGNQLLWSPAFRYGLFNPAHARLRFPARITALAVVGEGDAGAGVYVASGDRTYWLGGANPEQFTQRIVLPHGAVEGTTVTTLASVWGVELPGRVSAWLSTSGHFILGAPGGQVVRMLENQAATDVGEVGAATFREHDGVRQMIVALRGKTTAPGLRVNDAVVTRELGPAP